MCSAEELLAYSQKAHLAPARLSRLAEKVKEPVNAVVDCLGSTRCDLANYSKQYAAARRAFLGSSRTRRQEVVECYEARITVSQVNFLLHDRITQWDTDSGLSTISIESFGEDDDACDVEDEQFRRVYSGYLIEQGWAFPSEMDLLWRSFKTPWPRWERLWARY